MTAFASTDPRGPEFTAPDVLCKATLLVARSGALTSMLPAATALISAAKTVSRKSRPLPARTVSVPGAEIALRLTESRP